jgi:hypothetical protein
MIRVSLSYIFELATSLEPLGTLAEADTPWGDVWLGFYSAQSAIDTLYSQTLYTPYLRSSAHLAGELSALIKSQTSNQEFNRSLSRFEIWQVRNAYEKFKVVLLAELGVLHSYFVTQKGGFDTISLLAFGENLFPPDLASKVPEAIFDAREAGKCLAFELPTACGFHVFRATESVLRKYYSQLTGSKALPKVRNIGVYLNAMKQRKVGDEKVTFALKQMAELYRNPLIHPDTVLTQEEAIGIFGLARSAIAGMLAVLPAIPPTTALPQITGVGVDVMK